MNLSTLRGVTYGSALVAALTAIAGLAASWAASKGYGTYDAATDVFDPGPFDVKVLVAVVVSALGNVVAGVAWWFGWARK